MTTDNNKKRVIVAVDIGSSSVRCSAYEFSPDENLASSSSLVMVTSCARSQRAVQPTTGQIHVEQVLASVHECLDETLRTTDKDYVVEALGFSTFVMNLVGVDAEGQPIPQATMSYACNTPEVVQQVQALKRQLGEEQLKKLYQQTGAPIHSAYALAQLLVFYSQHAEIAGQVHKWQTLASLCLARWSKRPHVPISFSEASWTGLLNFSTCRYEPTLIDLLPAECRQALPELADFDQFNTKLDVPNWPGHKTAQLTALGVGDGACATIGSNCGIDSIACTVGTSAAARVCVPCPVGSAVSVPPGLFCYRVDRSLVLIGGALTDGGSVVEWVSQLLNLQEDEDFERCMKQVQALAEADLGEESSSSLVMVPFLSGERSTGFRSGATGAVLGLTRDTTPAHLLKAALEGVTLRLAAIVKLIQQTMISNQTTTTTTGSSGPRIIASGKALEVNAVWRQMLADATGLEVVFDSDTKEGTSRGVACLISMALAKRDTAEEGSADVIETELVQSSTVSMPRETLKEYWRRATDSQEQFIDAISPLFTQS